MPNFEFNLSSMSAPLQVAFHTLGCKLNYSETSSIGRKFEESGYGVVPFTDPADIYVINTCSVTEFADKKCRQYVRRALKNNPEAKVVVIGCYAQLKPKEISEIPGVDLVLGAAEKFRILEFINDLTYHHKGQVFASAVEDANVFEHAYSHGNRTRSFLKIQDGCDYSCSFCTIPLARGKSRSDTIDNIVTRAKEIAHLGVHEIVLTGVNIGDFGQGTEVIEGKRNKKEALFIDLIKELDQVEGINRFRISSIEPNLLTDEIIDFVASSKRFMPHFHIPLQSGNNKQLAMMRRRYKRELYAERVQKIKTVMPHCCIGVDVIVGFPGESEADFMESYKFIQELDVSYLHVFTYSERANTDAINIADAVPKQERKQRNEMLRILSDKKQRNFYSNHKNKSISVLFEQSKVPGQVTGHSQNYIQVNASSEKYKPNTIHDLQLVDFDANGKGLVSAIN